MLFFAFYIFNNKKQNCYKEMYIIYNMTTNNTFNNTNTVNIINNNITNT